MIGLCGLGSSAIGGPLRYSGHSAVMSGSDVKG